MFCRAQLVELRDNYPAIQDLGAVVIAVSTDDLEGAEYAIEQFGAPYPIAYTSGDPALPVRYGVFNLHGDGLASASTFIIGRDGELKWKDIGTAYSDHAPVATIIEQLKAIAAGS